MAIALVTACALFVLSSSRSHPIRHTLSGATHRSRVERHASDESVLREQGGAVHVLVLQGHLFFGNATAIADAVLSRLRTDALPPVRFLVLDFRLVTGFDSSAAMSLERLRTASESQELEIVLADTDESVLARLRRSGMLDAAEHPIRLLPDLDRAVEWCEEQLLAGKNVTADRIDDWQQVLTAFAEQIDVPAGHVLFRRGDRGDAPYYLMSGQVTALTNNSADGARIATIRPGTLFGEIGLFNGAPRSATVIADEPSTLRRLSRDALRRIEREDPGSPRRSTAL